MRMKNKETEIAIYLLKQSGLPLIAAARLVLELVDGCGDMARCRRAVVLGTEALKKEEQSVPFAEAVAYTRQVKQHRAARTQSDIAYYMSVTVIAPNSQVRSHFLQPRQPLVQTFLVPSAFSLERQVTQVC